ncbi:MAG: ABC transporter permease [Thermoanaerobaculales bacterium]|jgi:ABC-type polysaccharide/polyol phosphate export permease|nr:ABC transporter permease [Thermoanaerobaculales bacterium]
MQATAVPVLFNAADERLTVLQELRDLVDHRNLLWNLVRRDLTVRYKRSVIGFFWTMLNPLLLMIILTVVFSSLFRFEGIENYPTYFLSTYLVFGFFAQTSNQSMASLAWNGALMKRVRVPKSIFAVSTTLSGLVNLCLAYVPLFVIMLATGAPICLTVLYLPISFLLIAMFTLGVSLLLSALAVYFEDVQHMYQVATFGLMYMTPIIYPITIVPYKWLFVIRANPLTHLVKLARDPVYGCTLPGGHVILASVAAAVIALVLGWVVFHRLARGFYLHV